MHNCASGADIYYFCNPGKTSLSVKNSVNFAHCAKTQVIYADCLTYHTLFILIYKNCG